MDQHITHDSFFKLGLHAPKSLATLVAKSVPLPLRKRVQWSQIQAYPTELPKDLHPPGHTDLVCTAPMIGSAHNALLHLHVEHQSNTDKSMVLRTLDYAGSLLLRDHTRKGSARATPVPPLLIQFVVSNDPRGWRAVKNLDDLYDLDPELHEAYQALRIRHRYLVIDLAAMGDAELLERARDPHVLFVLQLMRIAREEHILSLLHPLADIIAAAANFADARLLFRRASCYVHTVNSNPDINPRAVLNELGRTGASAKEVARSSWEQTVQELRDEGRAEGRAEGRNESFIEALLIQVEARFGAAPEKLQIDRINSATRAQISHWIKHCASAPSLDQLLELAP